MKKLKSILCVASTLVTSVTCMAGCYNKNKDEYYGLAKSFSGFGTTAYVTAFVPEYNQEEEVRMRAFFNDVATMSIEYEKSLTTVYNPASPSSTYRFNQAQAGERIEVDKIFYDTLTMALELNAFTEGYYNPGVAYSVDLYGFSPRFVSIFPGFPGDSDYLHAYDRGVTTEQGKYATASLLPEQKYVTAFQQLGESFSQIQLEEQTQGDDTKYYVTKPASAQVTVEGDETIYTLQIELGGIAKGIIADKVWELYEQHGYDYGYFSFGSSSMAIRQCSTTASRNYNIGFINPRQPYSNGDRNTYINVDIKNANLSTSGDYENYYTINDVRYCHIINPKTGMPINVMPNGYSTQAVASATIIGGSAAYDDALTTALMCMGYQKAYSFFMQNADSKFLQGCTLCLAVPQTATTVKAITTIPVGSYRLQKNVSLLGI